MTGRGLTRAYIGTEIVFSASLVILTWLGTRRLEIQSTGIANTINYVLYLPVVYMIFRLVVGCKDRTVRA